MSPLDADLIIAGGGCAGLSALSHAMRDAGPERRIVVVDRTFTPRDDRTWAFWGTPQDPFADLADRTWERLRVRSAGFDTVQQIGTRSGGRRPTGGRVYARVRGIDYATSILERAHRCRNVSLVEADIDGFRDEAGAGVVATSDGELRAPVVLQSVARPPGSPAATVRHPLRQHFGGWEVRTSQPVFDPDVVTLMDFDAPQHDGTAFFYVLPDAADRALVEYTVFSPTVRPKSFYDDHLTQYLDRLGAGPATIERTEYGAIPMEDRSPAQQSGRHVWNLGTVGGMTKPTTGYTFQRIHAQTSHLITQWSSGRPLTALPSAPSRYGFADRTLLNILHRRAELGRPIFERLFRTSAIDDVLTFLDERSTLAADARMIAALPLGPFLRAAGSELVHALAGRSADAPAADHAASGAPPRPVLAA